MKAKTYVISKGRANRQQTRKQLIELGVPHTTVVEREDFDAYRQALDGNYLILDKSNQGVSYARNACILHAIQSGTDIFNIIDDDISIGITPAYCQGERFVKRKYQLVTRDDFYKLYDWFWSSEYNGLTLNYEQFAFRTEIDASLCGMIYGFTLMKTKDIAAKNLRYDLSLRTQEDLDFSLKFLRSGLKTIRLNTYTIRTPAMGSHQGGCHDDYLNGQRQLATLKVYERHPEPYTYLRNTRFLGFSALIDRNYFRKEFGLPSDAEYCKTHSIVGNEKIEI